MPSLCFYFQVHQPFRVKAWPEGALSGAKQRPIFDDEANRRILCKVAEKCYLPTNQLLLDLIKQHEGRFRVSFSISGVAIEQMQLYYPQVLESFVELAESGCVEFLAETYNHSLAALYNKDEFAEQVWQQCSLMQSLFGQKPRIFRNTELIYDDQIGKLVAELGFDGMIAEGVDDILGWRSPNFLYSLPDSALVLLLKNYRLSDDIAFRFSDRNWKEYPLTAEKFSTWAHQIDGSGEVLNLFMDYETFGEHQWADSGIFNFLRALPEQILRKPSWNFKTPTEIIETYRAVSELSFPRLTSWADLERDLSAWRGNHMQTRALEEVFALAPKILSCANDQLIEDWRRLLTSDHFYYMCTKWFADGDVHAYFSPFESPYEAFIHYMAALKTIDTELEAVQKLVSRSRK